MADELILNRCYKENLDKVYFVPMGNNYDKNELIDFSHRKNMIDLAIENEEKTKVIQRN